MLRGGAGPGGPGGRQPPQKRFFGRYAATRNHRLMGKHLRCCRADISPPRVFLPRSCSSDPTGRGRCGTPRKQDNNTMAFCTYPLAQSGGSGGAKPPKESYIIRSVSPLSDITIIKSINIAIKTTNNAPVAIKERGQNLENARFRPIFGYSSISVKNLGKIAPILTKI